MKRLLLPLLLSISPICLANQPVDKVVLQALRTEIINQSQEIEKNLNDIAAQYGDLCIVPMKIANELRAHDVVKKTEEKLIAHFYSQILEKGSISFDTEELLKIFPDEKDREQGYKIFEDIKKKYEEEGNRIYQALLEKCRNNDPDISLMQCNLVHTSQCDLVSLYLTLYCGNAVAHGVLQQIDALLQLP